MIYRSSLTPLSLCLSLLLLTGNAFASVIEVSTNAYSETRCAYFHYTLSDIHFSYKENLPLGTKVFVHFGFSKSWNNEISHWQKIEDQELVATYPDAWEAILQAIPVQSRGEFDFTAIEFVFRIVRPDGSIYWNNGGSSMGYYIAQIPSMTCERGQLQSL
jgi:hypothetical protein